jgi:hypothetical protein
MILGVVAGAAASVWDSGTTDRARGLIPLIPTRTSNESWEGNMEQIKKYVAKIEFEDLTSEGV